MSLRPEISGFNLKKMLSLFGCGDKKLIKEIQIELKKTLSDYPVITKKEFRELSKKGSVIIKQAILKGAPFSDLVNENDSHVAVADVFARHNQERCYTDSADWKMGAFWGFESQYENKLDQTTKGLLSFLIDGRPLFGREIEQDWSYYAYLSLAEVKQLQAGLIKLQESCPELEGEEFMDGFIDELIGWLDTISGKNLDLWLYAS